MNVSNGNMRFNSILTTAQAMGNGQTSTGAACGHPEAAPCPLAAFRPSDTPAGQQFCTKSTILAVQLFYAINYSARSDLRAVRRFTSDFSSGFQREQTLAKMTGG